MPRSQTDSYALRVYAAGLLISIAVLVFAYYLQHYKMLDPCPWCVAQRVLFIGVGLLSLIGLLQHPGVAGARVYGVMGALLALSGAAAAAYQIWLQSDPMRAGSCMGGWLEHTLDYLQLGKLWPNYLQYDGPCTLPPWELLTLSIPEWSLTWFAILGAAFTTLLLRRA
ncbi:MAG TPA: disulfide bond formation protein B [Burkholderiales bacterium]|jgi:protein dithiol:quinone oxidoreductase|nr:disulfide bond formation protein B [Burkholderiales bacterium]